jgi:TldD protein
MDTLSSSRSDGLGVRVVKGDDTAYAHTPGTTVRSLARGLAEASSLSGVTLALPVDVSDDAILDERPDLPALDPGFFHDLDRALRAECGYLRQATFRYRTSVKSVLIVRGDGAVARDRRAYTTFAANVVLDRDGDLQTGYEVRSLLTGVDDFWTHGGACTAEEIAREALARGILMLDAIPCPAGAMTVLMEGTAGGTMIHEACGHSLEADIIQKDYSVFRDRLGEVVANPLVTIVDDATLPGRYGSYACDDEGTPARRTVLVEDGVLKSYLTDIVSARLGGLPRTGNGRRESYQHVPLPRMSNTFIAPGTSTREEMLTGMVVGLLVRKMGGG